MSIQVPQTKFGDRQIEQLLEDRPELREILENHHFLREWIRDRFNGGGVRQRVYWDASEPISKMDSECTIPTEFHPAHVRVTSRPGLLAEDKCIFLMFEFLNLENENGLNRLFELTYRGKVQRDNFARQAMLMEAQAVVRLQPILQQERYHLLLGRSKSYRSFMAVPKDITLDKIQDWEKEENTKRSFD